MLRNICFVAWKTFKLLSFEFLAAKYGKNENDQIASQASLKSFPIAYLIVVRKAIKMSTKNGASSWRL